MSLSLAFVLTFNISVSCSPPTIWSGCDATAGHSCLTTETQSYDEEEDYYNYDGDDHDHHCQDNCINMMVMIMVVMIKPL